MRVVVFGGSGFVGLNVAEHLLAAGDDVVLFDRAAPPRAALEAFAQSPGRLDVATADINDRAAVVDALRGAERCVYGATITSDAARETEAARSVVEVNLIGLLTVLEAAQAAGVARVVNLSSGAAYGDAAFDAPPLDEARNPADPKTLYALTKFAGERLGLRLSTLWGLDVRSVRLSSVFGPWERGTGVRDTLSPPFQVMRAALAGEPVRFERSDVRDWVYAPDVAAAVEALLKHPEPAFGLYNLGPPWTWDVVAWAEALRPWFPEIRPEIDPAAPTIRSHAARSRSAFATERLRHDVDVEVFGGLESTAERYARWALQHRSVITG